MFFSLSQCGKSVALSNQDCLPERVKIWISSGSPSQSKGFAARSNLLHIRRLLPHPKSTSRSKKRLRLTFALPEALFTMSYWLSSYAF